MITAAARAVRISMHFRQRGIEVLYFTNPVDAMLPMGMADFKGHKLVSVDSAELNLEDVGEVRRGSGYDGSGDRSRFLLQHCKRG